LKPNVYIYTPLNTNKKLFLGSVPGGSPGGNTSKQLRVHGLQFTVQGLKGSALLALEKAYKKGQFLLSPPKIPPIPPFSKGGCGGGLFQRGAQLVTFSKGGTAQLKDYLLKNSVLVPQCLSAFKVISKQIQ